MAHHFKTSALLAIVAALIVTGIASAHADFRRSDPAPNSALPTAPSKITIWFSEPIEPRFSTITVLFQDGATADAGDSAVSPTDATQLSVSLVDARQGTYIVSWRVISAADGHITSGSWVYSVGKPLDRSVSGNAGGSVTSPIDMLARALTFIGQALLAGVILFRWLVWRPALQSADLDDSVDERSIPRTRRIVFIALGIAAAGAVLTVLIQSWLTGTTITGWLSTRVGRIWIGRAATLIALAVLADDLAAIGRRKDRWGLPLNLAIGWLGAQLLLITSLTSHSASVTNPPILPLAVDWLHLMATALWVGGLAQMAFVVPAVAQTLDEEDRAWLWLRTVVYFSTVAAIGIGILLVTGTYMSSLHVGDWPSLLTTDYGRSLLFKLAIAGVAMLLGAYNLFIVKPKLDQAVDAPTSDLARSLQRRFRRIVSFEAVTAMAVLASAGILTALPRSRDPQLSTPGTRLELTTRAETLDAALTIDPAQIGSNTFNLRLTQNGKPITDAGTVSLRFTYLTRSLGTTEATAQPTTEGTYSTSGAYLSLAGDWQIEAAVRRPNAFDAFAAYRVKVGLDGRIGPVGEATPIESLSRWLSIYGLPFGGGVAIVMGLLWLAISLKASRNLLSQAVLVIPALIALPIGALSVITFFREATPTMALTNPFLPDEQSLAAGQKLFEANCAVCHGQAGRGDGPAAAGLSLRPPDYGNGHLDIHTDGDIFYWIQNGLPTVNSPMPAFKGKLTDDETWHLVNYVRRLRDQAGQAGPAPSGPAPSRPVSPPASSLQPYTPPSFIAPPESAAGSTPQLPTPAIPSDAAAIDLLRRADAAMNGLTSLVEDQQMRDDAGNQLDVRFEYAAPDKLRYTIQNGASSIQIGSDDYQPGPNGAWIKNRRAIAFKWPNFFYGRVADGARIDGSDTVDAVDTTIVAFQYDQYDFRVWIDRATDRILKITMDGPGHHMLTTYRDFNAGPPIEPPIP